jgi:hypothetical protein
MTAERHPNSARFHEYLATIGDMHDLKQQDYGRDDDPFANVREIEKMGIPAWVGTVIRNNDKQVRLQKAVRDTMLTGAPQLSNEGVRDTLVDMAVYAVIGLVLFEEFESRV